MNADPDKTFREDRDRRPRSSVASREVGAGTSSPPEREPSAATQSGGSLSHGVPSWQLDASMGDLARFLEEVSPEFASAVLDPRVLQFGREILGAKRELADPDSRLSWLTALVAGWYLDDVELVTWALDQVRGKLLAAGHFEVEIPRQRNGHPDFAYRPMLKIPLGPHIVTAAAEYRIINSADLFVYEEGDPLIHADELRRVFLAHERVPDERILRQMGRAFNELLSEWRQGEDGRVDTFIRELHERGIGATREAERLAKKRGLKLSRRTIGRRLADLP